MYNMKKYILIILSIFLLSSCGTTKIITKEVEKIEYIERVKTDTLKIEIPIPIEKVINVTTADSSYLETSVAISIATVDENGLNHILENKKISLQKDTIYNYIEVEKITEKIIDNTIIEEKKVKVVPWWCYITLAVIGGLIFLLIRSWFK